MSRGMSISRASRLASICNKEFDFQFFVFQEEMEYKMWLGLKRVLNWFNTITLNVKWNNLICVLCLLGLSFVAYDKSSSWQNKPLELMIFDIVFNIVYFIHFFGTLYNELSTGVKITFISKVRYLLDVISFGHYIIFYLEISYGLVTTAQYRDWKTIFYVIRLHAPVGYIWDLTSNNLTESGSVFGTTIKYIYVLLLVRVMFTIIFMHLIVYEEKFNIFADVAHIEMFQYSMKQYYEDPFSWCLYLVDKMFIPVGPQVYPFNDLERLVCMVIMIAGVLTVTGTAIATMAIVLSVSLQHEELFRSRLRLIVNEMNAAHVPKNLRRKVKTFYQMYWHKQRGVSGSKLLQIFPPTTNNLIYSEIYFEAQQRSLVLRDLSNQFLSEISRCMTTINYIPGDSIIKRKSAKSAIIYIAYGDVEMMSSEDDVTPMLRFSRGTVLNGCGACPAAACSPSHVEIRAATFCTAHVLTAYDLWKVVAKFGRSNGQAFIISSAFNEHFEKVQIHYAGRVIPVVPLKSSIIFFKRNLIELKQARGDDGKLILTRTDVFLEIAGSYIIRNRADASLTQESDRICLRSTFPCILQPQSSLLVAWNGLVAILTLIVVINYPYSVAHMYPMTPDWRFFDYLINFIFILDIITHLSTGANIEEGVPITFRQTSSQQMKSFWFLLDVVAVLPIFEFVGDGQFSSINKLLKLPKVFRSLKEMENVAVFHGNLIRFFSYALLLILTTYLLACLQQWFMCFQYLLCEVTDLQNPPFWTKSKVDRNKEVTRVYYGLYWAVHVFAFSMHKTASWKDDWAHRFYTMIVLEVCMIIRIFIEAVYSATIMVNLAMRSQYETCIMDVKNFFIRNNIDPMLQHRFINYLQLCWHTDRAYAITHNKQSMLFDLPPHVTNELLAMQRIKYIARLPFAKPLSIFGTLVADLPSFFFYPYIVDVPATRTKQFVDTFIMRTAKYLSESVLNHMATYADLFYTSPNEILLTTGVVTNELYIVKQGMCEVISPVTGKVVRYKSAKDHFGVLVCLLRLPSFYTVRAATHVQVFSIKYKYLQIVLKTPKIKDAISYAKRQKEYKSMLRHPKESFLKYQYPPPIPNRSFFPLPRKHEPDNLYLYPFERLGFLSILRYVFPRWTIRPDGHYMQRYEWFRALCAIMGAFVFPCYTYMGVQFPILHYITLFLDVAAYFDILQRLLVGYYNEKGILVYHPASTAAHYFKGAFVVDLMASLPLEFLDKGRSLEMAIKSMNLQTSVTQYLMCNRLLQLYRIPSAFNTLSVYIEREDIVLIIKAVPLILGLINVVTMCILEQSVQFYANTTSGRYLFNPYDRATTWIHTAEKELNFPVLHTPFNFHLVCYFWAVYEISTTGYNMFHPSNVHLIATLYFGNVVATMLTTYYSMRVISIRAIVNPALATFQEHMRDVKKFMERENIGKVLKKEVIDYYSYNWDKMGGTDYRSVLKLCDQITLRTDAIMHIYGPTFGKCPVLNECEVSLLRLMGRSVFSVYYLRDTRVIERDDVITDLYFVDYGTVEVKDATDDETAVTKLPRGSIFGNCSASAEMRSPNTFMSNSNVHLLKINTTTFYRIIDDFPHTMHLLQSYLQNRQHYIIGGQKDPTRAMSVWKERTFSTVILIATRKGAIKYLDTHTWFMQIFLIIISLACVYLDSYNAAFQDNGMVLILILYSLDVLFYLKILINYSMAKANFDKEIKLKLLKQQKIYLKGVFKYDVISVIPLELFCFLFENQWAAFAALRLNRIFRVMTIKESFKRHLEKLDINLVLTTLTSVAVWFTVFIHFMTCIWHYIGDVEESHQVNSSWMYFGADKPPCHSEYVCAFYFTLTTFAQDGVGDVMPKKRSEVIFCCILQIIATMLYMIYVGEFSNIIQYQSFRFFDHYTKHVELMEFLKFNRVTKNIMEMMNRYSLHLWQEHRGVQMPYFLETAPQCLHTKIMSAAYMIHLTEHPSFKTCEPAFLRQLVRHFKLYSYFDGMYVVKENEITDSMYMIHSGTVLKVAEDPDEQTEMLHGLNCFGVAQGLQKNTPFTHSYRVVGKAQVLTLCLNNWYYLVKHFPKTREVLFPGKGDDEDQEGEIIRVLKGKVLAKSSSEYIPTKFIHDTELEEDEGTKTTPTTRKEDEATKTASTTRKAQTEFQETAEVHTVPTSKKEPPESLAPVRFRTPSISQSTPKTKDTTFVQQFSDDIKETSIVDVMSVTKTVTLSEPDNVTVLEPLSKVKRQESDTSFEMQTPSIITTEILSVKESYDTIASVYTPLPEEFKTSQSIEYITKFEPTDDIEMKPLTQGTHKPVSDIQMKTAEAPLEPFMKTSIEKSTSIESKTYYATGTGSLPVEDEPKSDKETKESSKVITEEEKLSRKPTDYIEFQPFSQEIKKFASDIKIDTEKAPTQLIIKSPTEETISMKSTTYYATATKILPVQDDHTEHKELPKSIIEKQKYSDSLSNITLKFGSRSDDTEHNFEMEKEIGKIDEKFNENINKKVTLVQRSLSDTQNIRTEGERRQTIEETQFIQGKEINDETRSDIGDIKTEVVTEPEEPYILPEDSLPYTEKDTTALVKDVPFDTNIQKPATEPSTRVKELETEFKKAKESLSDHDIKDDEITAGRQEPKSDQTSLQKEESEFVKNVELSKESIFSISKLITQEKPAKDTSSATKFNFSSKTESKTSQSKISKDTTPSTKKLFPFAKKTSRFVPPAGPSMKDIGAPVDVPPNLWPMDSRRRSSEDMLFYEKLNGQEREEPEDSTQPPNLYGIRRKSTLWGVDRQAVDAEIQAMESEDEEEVQQIEMDKEKLQPQLKLDMDKSEKTYETHKKTVHGLEKVSFEKEIEEEMHRKGATGLKVQDFDYLLSEKGDRSKTKEEQASDRRKTNIPTRAYEDDEDEEDVDEMSEKVSMSPDKTGQSVPTSRINNVESKTPLEGSSTTQFAETESTPSTTPLKPSATSAVSGTRPSILRQPSMLPVPSTVPTGPEASKTRKISKTPEVSKTKRVSISRKSSMTPKTSTTPRLSTSTRTSITPGPSTSRRISATTGPSTPSTMSTSIRTSSSRISATPRISTMPRISQLSRRKSLAVHLRNAAKRFQKERKSSAGDKDSLMLRDQEQATQALLNRPRGQSDISFKRARSLTQSNLPRATDLGLDYNTFEQKVKKRKSVIGFKKDVTTYEVPKNDLESVSYENLPQGADPKSEEASMKAYIDDITLKKSSARSRSQDSKQEELSSSRQDLKSKSSNYSVGIP